MRKVIENNEIFCSVVMPVHNGERFLREAIESVLNQTYTNFEFLIIENCSNDSSVEIIKSYKDGRIRLIIEEDCGIVQGYNRGFKEAKGEYIVVHDQDDFSVKSRIKKQLNNIIENNLDICGSYFNIIDLNNEILEKKKGPLTSSQISFELFFYRMAVFNPTVTMRTKVFETYGLFNERYQYDFDYEFYLRIKDKVKIGNYPEFLYSWRYWKNSTSYNIRQEADNSSVKLALKELENNNEKYSREYNLIKGCIYYYNNQLIKSLKYLISYKPKKYYYQTLKRRYMLIILGGNVITKFVRYFGLYNNKVFIKLKHLLNKKYSRYN